MTVSVEPDTGPGRRLGVDVGEVRIGVALSDPSGVLATPLVTLKRDRVGGTDLDSLAALVAEHEVVEVVIGLPRTLAGRDGPAARAAQHYARALAGRLGATIAVRLTDERFTTVAATRMLAQRGIRGRRQRAVVDQAAAVEILQGWLEVQRQREASGGTGTEKAP